MQVGTDKLQAFQGPENANSALTELAFSSKYEYSVSMQ